MSADFGPAAFEPAASWVSFSAQAFVSAAAVFEPSAAAGACLVVVADGESAAFELAASWVSLAARTFVSAVAGFEPAAAAIRLVYQQILAQQLVNQQHLGCCFQHRLTQAFVSAAAVFEPSATAGACLLIVAVGEPAAFELAASYNWVLFAARASVSSHARRRWTSSKEPSAINSFRYLDSCSGE